MKKVLIVIGTRPNFIKVTRFKKLVTALSLPIDLRMVHTGQHYDQTMTDVFFKQFDLMPDYFLHVKPNAPVAQMAEMMQKLEALIDSEFLPDLMIVPGDVNSTLAAALVANKKRIKLAHLESGLRSGDRAMPEEWNRILTDELADYYFVTEPSGLAHLQMENKKGKSFYVGNTMIDTMVAFEERIKKSRLTIKPPFVMMTIHRPSNVDHPAGLEKLLSLLELLDGHYSIVFPIHPRTSTRIKSFNLEKAFHSRASLILTEPLSYFDCQKLLMDCSFILTDSGGIQGEATFYQKPCLTLRENTEQPITITQGTNTLVPFDTEVIQGCIDEINGGTYKKGRIPELWDGRATERILQAIDAMSL